jgi:hypothetical protein
MYASNSVKRLLLPLFLYAAQPMHVAILHVSVIRNLQCDIKAVARRPTLRTAQVSMLQAAIVNQCTSISRTCGESLTCPSVSSSLLIGAALTLLLLLLQLLLLLLLLSVHSGSPMR